MKAPTDLRRIRIAELRTAVIRAHPDHGGTTEALQQALAAFRAEHDQRPSTPAVSPTQPRSGRPRRSPATPRPSRRGTLAGVLVGTLWLYGVVLPIVLGLALLVARANAWLVGG